MPSPFRFTLECIAVAALYIACGVVMTVAM